MSTNKPRIQAYIDIDLYNHFEVQRINWGVSQSQALERILADRFQGEQPREGVKDIAASFEHEFTQYTFKALRDLQNEVGEIQDYLRELKYSIKQAKLHSSLPSELDSSLPSELDSSLPSESNSELDSSLPSELDSSLPSELDSSLPSELDSSLPSELDSNLPSELDSSLPSELDSSLPSELDSSLPSELDSSLPSELDSSLPSELDSSLPSEPNSELDCSLLSESIITKNIAVSLPENLSQALSESPIELNKIVICAINKETNLFYFWNGSQKGFTNSIVNAKRYKSEGMAERARLGILKDDYFSDYYSGSFELRYNTVRYFQENTQFKPKGRELAKV